jgi:monoamine oxidase
VTLPPTLAGRLEYAPALPSWRDQLTQRLPAGSVIKLYAIYPEPFWRADGLTGQAASDEGPVKVTFDNSPPSGTPGILMGFMEADDGRELGPAQRDERRRAGRRLLRAVLRPEGRRSDRVPRARLDGRGVQPRLLRRPLHPGVWTAYGDALRTPIGPIHWAGAECSPCGTATWRARCAPARAADDVAATLG